MNVNYIISPAGDIYKVSPGYHRQEIAQRIGYDQYATAWHNYLCGDSETPPSEKHLTESEFAEAYGKDWGQISDWTYTTNKCSVIVPKTQVARDAMEKLAWELPEDAREAILKALA
jgi:hypothetical protein